MFIKADLTIEPKEGDFKLDDKVIIKCKVTVKPTIMKGPNQHLIHQRHPKPSIFWYKENDALKSNPSDARKIEIDTKYENSEQVLASYLIIYNARYEDTGKYRCTYDNMQEQVNVKVNNDCKSIFPITFSQLKFSNLHLIYFYFPFSSLRVQELSHFVGQRHQHHHPSSCVYFICFNIYFILFLKQKK